ncbi:hypothetical protein [Nonomuraea pusilla]|uniref:hypothetical protein n=1 Tax=Nonomuraea pusilla TaxID=46177 RepID=UPI0006E45606|nr:hypothetical protein [Nonomuraea pusilla]
MTVLTRALGLGAAAVLSLAVAAAPSAAQGASADAVRAAGPATHPAQPARAPHPVLTCKAGTAAPITFTPQLGQQAASVTVSGALSLTGCTSPDNSRPRLRSGKLTFTGSALASCTGIKSATGSGKIVWKDAQGVVLGTSTVVPNLAGIDSYNPGDVLLFGEITDGVMKGVRTAGNATPTTDISQCSAKGLSGIEGSGTVSFITTS